MNVPKATHPPDFDAGTRLAAQLGDAEPVNMRALIDKYGKTQVFDYFVTCTMTLGKISENNKQIAALGDRVNDPEYQALIDSARTDTDDYYQFIQKMPTDARNVFLRLFGTEKLSDSELYGISELFTIPALSELFPSLQTIRPKNYVMQVDTITNHLPRLTGQNQLKVGMRGNQPVKTTVTLDIPEHMKIEDGTVLSTYDKSVINGVTSLLESGNMTFSIPMLYHAMTGKQNPTVDEPLYEELSGKLEKMRRLMISIDLSEENKAQYITGEDGETLEVSDMKIEGYLLPLNKVTAMLNGKKAEVFQLLSQPPIYTYSKMKHQLTSIPISLLNAPINNNATTIPLKSYLLQRIELMKNKNNSMKSTTILYDSIYAELPGATENKTRKMRIRGYTVTILDYLKEQGYISNFAEYKTGRAIAGIKIEL